MQATSAAAASAIATSSLPIPAAAPTSHSAQDVAAKEIKGALVKLEIAVATIVRRQPDAIRDLAPIHHFKWEHIAPIPRGLCELDEMVAWGYRKELVVDLIAMRCLIAYLNRHAEIKSLNFLHCTVTKEALQLLIKEIPNHNVRTVHLTDCYDSLQTCLNKTLEKVRDLNVPAFFVYPERKIEDWTLMADLEKELNAKPLCTLSFKRAVEHRPSASAPIVGPYLAAGQSFDYILKRIQKEAVRGTRKYDIGIRFRDGIPPFPRSLTQACTFLGFATDCGHKEATKAFDAIREEGRKIRMQIPKTGPRTPAEAEALLVEGFLVNHYNHLRNTSYYLEAGGLDPRAESLFRLGRHEEWYSKTEEALAYYQKAKHRGNAEALFKCDLLLSSPPISLTHYFDKVSELVDGSFCHEVGSACLSWATAEAKELALRCFCRGALLQDGDSCLALAKMYLDELVPDLPREELYSHAIPHLIIALQHDVKGAKKLFQELFEAGLWIPDEGSTKLRKT